MTHNIAPGKPAQIGHRDEQMLAWQGESGRALSEARVRNVKIPKPQCSRANPHPTQTQAL